MGPDREADGAAQVKCLLINSKEPPHNQPPKMALDITSLLPGDVVGKLADVYYSPREKFVQSD